MGKEFKMMTLGVIAMIALSAMILTGIALTNQYSYEFRTPTTANSSSSSVATLLINTSVLVGTSGQYPFLQDLTGCVNETGGNALAATQYQVFEGTKFGGYAYLQNLSWNNTGVNCSSVEYLASNGLTTTADAFLSGLAIFAVFSVIVALALVGKIIMDLFTGKGRKEDV